MRGRALLGTRAAGGSSQAPAGENVTAGLNRDVLAVEGAACQTVGTRTAGPADNLSARETQHNTNTPDRLSTSPYSRAKSVDRDHRSSDAVLASSIGKTRYQRGREMRHAPHVEESPAALEPVAGALKIGK